MNTVSEEQVLFNKLNYEEQQFILKQMRLLQPCEIIEEKKIPERLNKNYYITQPDINQPSKISYNMEQLVEMVQDIYEKQGEICDYLKSKGE